jgi:enamine deaminase RidA (YjgF/YER057c/UK114 family)
MTFNEEYESLDIQLEPDVDLLESKPNNIIINNQLSKNEGANHQIFSKDQFITCIDISNVFGSDKIPNLPLELETESVLNYIRDKLLIHDMDFSHIISTTVYVKDMTNFSNLNKIYRKYFGINPPNRTTVQSNINNKLQIDLVASKYDRDTLHVQGYSYWASANIGPYSQASITNVISIAGQIGLIPYSMKLALTFPEQLSISLQNLTRISSVLKTSFGRLLQCTCYVTQKSFIKACKNEFGKHTKFKGSYVVVPNLPRNANVEFATIFAPCRTELDIVSDPFESKAKFNFLQGVIRLFEHGNYISARITSTKSQIDIETLNEAIERWIKISDCYNVQRMFHLEKISSQLIRELMTKFGYIGALICVPVMDMDEGYLSIEGWCA